MTRILLPALLLVSCGSAPEEEPADPQQARDVLTQMVRAENTDARAFLDFAATDLDLAGPIEADARGFVRNQTYPCGSSVRPYIVGERPFLGQTLRLAYHTAGLPLDDPSRLGTAFIAIGLGPAPTDPWLELPPSRCPFYIDIGKPGVLLYQVKPGTELEGPLLWHEPQSRIVWLSTPIPDVEQVIGQTFHTQMAVFDAGQQAWKTSQLTEVRLGRSISGN